MGRPKKNNKFPWEQSVKEIFASRDFDAVDEMLKVYYEKIEVHPGDDLEPYMESREVVREGGKIYLRPKLKLRLEILFEAAQYQRPKLRSTETKGTIDYNFNLTIKEFPAEEPKRVDVVDVTPRQLTE